MGSEVEAPCGSGQVQIQRPAGRSGPASKTRTLTDTHPFPEIPESTPGKYQSRKATHSQQAEIDGGTRSPSQKTTLAHHVLLIVHPELQAFRFFTLEHSIKWLKSAVSNRSCLCKTVPVLRLKVLGPCYPFSPR